MCFYSVFCCLLISFILARSAGLSSYSISVALISVWILLPSFEMSVTSYVPGMSLSRSLFLYLSRTFSLSSFATKS